MNEHIIKQNHELTRRRQVISKLFLVNSKDEEIKDSVSERKNTGKEEILAGYREVILSSSTDEIVQKFIQIKEEKTSLSQPVWFLELVLKLKKQGMDILVNSILPIDAESNHFVLDTVWGSEALSQFFELKKELTYDEMRSLSRSIFNYRSCTEMIKSARTSNIDMKQLAKAMFAENKGVYVFQNTQYFKDLDQSWLLKMAIKTGNIEYLISRIKDFSFSTAELAMIEQDALKNSCVESLIAAESSFPDADRDLILQKLIDNGNMRLLSDELDYFSSCNRTVIAEAFIENYRIYYLFENFDFFKQIRAELLLEKIVDSGHGHDVFTYIDYFESYDTDKFIELLLAKKKFGSLIRCLSKTESSINVLDVLEKAMEGNQISVDHLYKVWGYLKEIDPDVLMRLCLKYNYQGFVVKKLSHFPNANITMLLESMGEDKLIYCFLEWSEKLSQDQLKKVLVATIHTEFHNEVFRYWSNLSDHHNMIIDEFWNCELNYPLSSHMDVIMHSNIDFKRLGERFLEASQFEIIRKYSETFHQVDKKKLAETILSSNSYFDVDIMYYFKYLDPTAKMKYLNKFISVYPDVMLTHFSLFKDIDRSSVADDFRSLELDTQNQFLIDCVKNKEYDTLCFFISEFQIELQDGEGEYSWLKSQIKEEVFAKNFETVKSLCALGKKLFPHKSDEFISIETYLSNEVAPQEKIEREPYREINCFKEIFRYYILVLLRQNYKTTLELNEKLGQRVNNEITSLFKKVREYMVFAVNSEIKHAQDKFAISASPRSNRLLYQEGTEEEIRVMFHQVKGKFIDPRGFDQDDPWGGASWGNIAEFGEKMWADGVLDDIGQQVFLLNIVVGLQHNSGYFFDKDKVRVNLKNVNLEMFLDWEASGDHSISDFFEWYKKNDNSDEMNALDDLKELSMLCKDKQKQIEQNGTSTSFTLLTLQSRVFNMKTTEIIDELSQNEEIPLEVRDFLRSAYSQSEGFTMKKTGPILLGRLLKTMSVEWTKDFGMYKELVSNENKIIYMDIKGFVYAFWYDKNTLKTIDSVKTLREMQPLLSKMVDQPIVQAQYGYIREGD